MSISFEFQKSFRGSLVEKQRFRALVNQVKIQISLLFFHGLILLCRTVRSRNRRVRWSADGLFLRANKG